MGKLLLTLWVITALGIPVCLGTSSTIVVPDDYARIQWAIDAASPGDMIRVNAGTYYEYLSITKPLRLIGSGRDSTTIDALGARYAIAVNSDNVTIKGLAVKNNGDVIYVENANHCSILNNRIEGRGFVVYLQSSSNCAVADNMIIGGYEAIEMAFSSNITLERNTIANNKIGVVTIHTRNCVLRNNNLTNNQDAITIHGVNREENTHDIDTSNTVNGRPIHYIVSERDLIIEPTSFPEIGYLGIVNCENVTVKDVVITNAGQGILLAFTKNATIENTTLTENLYGMGLESSPNCQIRSSFMYSNVLYGISAWRSDRLRLTNNNITHTRDYAIELCWSDDCLLAGNSMIGSKYGAYLANSNWCNITQNTIANTTTALRFYRSHSNTIYHNNFLDYGEIHFSESAGILWDKGLPLGGNYWSNYKGQDLNEDGTGDTPYVIDAENMDNHPLMRQSGWMTIVEIDMTTVSRRRTSVDSLETVSFHAAWYSNRTATKGGTLYVNGTRYTTNQSGWMTFNHSAPTVGKKGWTISGVNCSGVTSYTQTAPNPTIVWDRVDIRLSPRGDRCSVGSEGIIVAAHYSYDGDPFQGEVFLNDTSTKEVVGRYGYRAIKILDERYGLDVFSTNEFSLIFDRINIRLRVLDDRVDVGSTAPIQWTATYQYDGEPFTGTITLNDTTIPSIPSIPCLRGYKVESINDPVHGVWVFRSNEVSCIFDRVKVDVHVSDDRVDVGDSVEVGWAARYEYDDVPFNGSMALNATQTSYGTVGRRSFTALSVSDALHGLTAFASNTASCIWDRIRIVATVDDDRIDVRTAAEISVDAFYQYDKSSFLGSVSLNDTLTKEEVGRYTYTVDDVLDPKNGITTFTSNAVDVVFDRVNVTLTTTTPKLIVGKNASILVNAIYEFDGQPLSGSVALNDTIFIQDTPGTRAYRASAVLDDLYGLEAYSTNEVSIAFEASVPEPLLVMVAVPFMIATAALREGQNKGHITEGMIERRSRYR